MHCSSLFLLFIELITFSHSYMLWNRHQIDYERFKKAFDEAIAEKEEKKYDSPLDLSKQVLQENSQDALSNLRSWFPLWASWSSRTIQMPSILPSTTNLPILSTSKPQNFTVRSPRSSKIAFPKKQRSTQKSKTIKHIKSRKLTNGGPKKSKNKQYNPLCFFSALPCGPRRKDVYYVPRKN